MIRLLFALAFTLVAGAASAQSCFPDASGTRANCGVVPGSIAGGIWSPLSTTNPLPVNPNANTAGMVRGTASGTDTAAHTIIAAQGAGVKTYVTGLQCYRSDAGTSAIVLTLSDGASSIVVLPNSGGGGGSNVTFSTPLVTAANTAFTFTSGTSTSTVYCSAQGFTGS